VDEVERARLVERNIDLASRAAAVMAKRIGHHLEYDELLSYANVGLAEAAASFDETKGTAFATWAWYRIQGTMLDGMRRNTNLPRNVWRKLIALRAASEYLEHYGERDVGAASRGAKPKEGKDALAQIKDSLSAIRTMYMTSLDTMVSEGFDQGDDKPAGEEQLDATRRMRRLRRALASLPDKERALVTKHYYEGKSLLDAGAELGISKSWASRLHSQVVEKLRAVVDAET
jgi:RNA polymerase sigma factor for flagellar operon FliA